MKLKIGITLLMIAAWMHTYSQTADEIIGNHLSYIGGIDKLKAIRSKKYIAMVTTPQGDYTLITFNTPIANRTEKKIMGFESIFAINKHGAWVLNPGNKNPVKLNQVQRKEIKVDPWENVFINYKEKGHEATLLGVEELDGIKCFKIQFILNKYNDEKDHLQILFFDTESYFLVMGMESSKAEKKTHEIRVMFGDHHEVEGLVFPFYFETKVDGQSTKIVSVDKIILNEPMDDSIFEIPKKN